MSSSDATNVDASPVGSTPPIHVNGQLPTLEGIAMEVLCHILVFCTPKENSEEPPRRSSIKALQALRLVSRRLADAATPVLFSRLCFILMAPNLAKLVHLSNSHLADHVLELSIIMVDSERQSQEYTGFSAGWLPEEPSLVDQVRTVAQALPRFKSIRKLFLDGDAVEEDYAPRMTGALASSIAALPLHSLQLVYIFIPMGVESNLRLRGLSTLVLHCGYAHLSKEGLESALYQAQCVAIAEGSRATLEEVHVAMSVMLEGNWPSLKTLVKFPDGSGLEDYSGAAEVTAPRLESFQGPCGALEKLHAPDLFKVHLRFETNLFPKHPLSQLSRFEHITDVTVSIERPPSADDDPIPHILASFNCSQLVKLSINDHEQRSDIYYTIQLSWLEFTRKQMQLIVQSCPNLEGLSVWSIDCKEAEEILYATTMTVREEVEAHRQNALSVITTQSLLPKLSMFQDMRVVRSEGKATLVSTLSDEYDSENGFESDCDGSQGMSSDDESESEDDDYY